VLLILNGNSFGLRKCLQATARGNRIFGECRSTIFLVDRIIKSHETDKLEKLLESRDEVPANDAAHLFNFFATHYEGCTDEEKAAFMEFTKDGINKTIDNAPQLQVGALHQKLIQVKTEGLTMLNDLLRRDEKRN
jgi:hypothetical protein